MGAVVSYVQLHDDLSHVEHRSSLQASERSPGLSSVSQHDQWNFCISASSRQLKKQLEFHENKFYEFHVSTTCPQSSVGFH